MGNPLTPQIMAIHICKYDDNSTTTVCSCAFHSWPPPDIQWYMNHQHLTKQNISGDVNIISSTQGNTITSSIYLRGNALNSYIISCRGINPFGFSNLKTLSILAKKGDPSFHQTRHTQFQQPFFICFKPPVP
uniref:Ig-like domain-containing protein n=1 Tax=Pseudonaja textilis TaxID=8673 RepID=A0A670ZE86_PSETE